MCEITFMGYIYNCPKCKKFSTYTHTGLEECENCSFQVPSEDVKCEEDWG